MLKLCFYNFWDKLYLVKLFLSAVILKKKFMNGRTASDKLSLYLFYDARYTKIYNVYVLFIT